MPDRLVKATESKPVKVGHIDSWRMRLRASTGAGSLTSYVTFIPYGQATWRITGLTRTGDAKHYLGRALDESGGNKTKAAELTGLPSYQTFANWMTKYGGGT